jgi:DNA-binding GntR family transcriptional regulator
MVQNMTPSGFDFTTEGGSSTFEGLSLPTIEFDQGLPAKIADQLGVAIIEGKLAPGARLSEPELAEAFGTSRTPVREALRILERDNLVELAPRRGARVTAIDASRAMGIYVCRAYLYGLAARITCLRIGREELDELAATVDAMERFTRAGDTESYFRLNVHFHSRVTEIADNPMLSVLIQQLGRATLRLRFIAIMLPGRAEESLAAHQRLLVALGERRASEAERIVRSIIRDSGVSLLRYHYGDAELAVELETLLRDR